jgi:hypothetical protein
VPTQPQPAPTGPVQRAVTKVRHVADPVVKALPAAVQTPVNNVGDTVQQVAGTVDRTVGGTGLRLP